MILDVLLVIILAFAVIKGYRQGFIIAFFSLVAFVIGLAAAIKLSAITAVYIGNTVNLPKKWLPILSFLAVFFLVVFLVRSGAALLQKSIETVFLGWLNRLGGILFYLLIYLVIYSILLYFTERLNLLEEDDTANTFTWKYIRPLGPAVIDATSNIIPVFKNMFAELDTFFEAVSANIPLDQTIPAAPGQ